MLSQEGGVVPGDRCFVGSKVIAIVVKEHILDVFGKQVCVVRRVGLGGGRVYGHTGRCILGSAWAFRHQSVGGGDLWRESA